MKALPSLNMTLGNTIARRRLRGAACRNEGEGENRAQTLFILKRRRAQTAVVMASSVSPNLAVTMPNRFERGARGGLYVYAACKDEDVVEEVQGSRLEDNGEKMGLLHQRRVGNSLAQVCKAHKLVSVFSEKPSTK